MKKRIHAVAGVLGFTTIAAFWTSTVLAELFGSPADIAAVKETILWGMIILVPTMIITAGSGQALGRNRVGPKIERKKRRMPIIALNGLLVLVPSAVFLAHRASAGQFDSWFYGIQAVELVAGVINLSLMGMNIRDGLLLSGRMRRSRSRQTSEA